MDLPISNELKLQYIDILISQSKYSLKSKSSSASFLIGSLSPKASSLLRQDSFGNMENVSDIEKFQLLKKKAGVEQIQSIIDAKIDKSLDVL